MAQLDKASDYESEDWGFKSLQGYFIFSGKPFFVLKELHNTLLEKCFAV